MPKKLSNLNSNSLAVKNFPQNSRVSKNFFEKIFFIWRPWWEVRAGCGVTFHLEAEPIQQSASTVMEKRWPIEKLWQTIVVNEFQTREFKLELVSFFSQNLNSNSLDTKKISKLVLELARYQKNLQTRTRTRSMPKKFSNSYSNSRVQFFTTMHIYNKN